MKFCKECGHKLNHQALFCGECGTSVTSGAENAGLDAKDSLPTTQAEVSATAQTPVQPQPPKMKPASSFKLTKGMKIWGSVVILIAVLLFGGYKVGESLTARDKVIESFKQAIAEKDKEKLNALISSKDPRLVVDEARIESFLKYLDKNPSYFSRLMDSIKEQSERLAKLEERNKEDDADSYDYTGDSFVKLKKDGKKWLIYDNYTFEVKPYFINVYTNYKDTKILLDGKEVGKAKKNDYSKELGPFMPGIYTVKAVYEGEYASLDEEIELEVFEDDRLEVDLSLYGEYVTPYSNYTGAKLYVNGKDTGKFVEEAEAIGPIQLDGSVTMMAVKTFPWGEVRSEEVKIVDSFSTDLMIEPMNQELKDQLMSAINEFNKGWSAAYNSMDVNLFTNVTSERKDYYGSDLDYMLESGMRYSGEFKRSTFDLDSFELYTYDNEFEASLNCMVEYNAAWYYEGESVDPMPEQNQLNYSLIYDEELGEWQVTYAYNIGYMDLYNIQEFEF